MYENVQIVDSKKQSNKELIMNNLGKNHNLIIKLKNGQVVQGWVGLEDGYYFIGGLNFNNNDIVDVEVVY